MSAHTTLCWGGEYEFTKDVDCGFTLTGDCLLGPVSQPRSGDSAGNGIQTPSATASKAEVRSNLRQELARSANTIESCEIGRSNCRSEVAPAFSAKIRRPRLINPTYPAGPSAQAVEAEAACSGEPVVP